MEKIVIIGGGIAGLSCLNALLDRNISALLLEGSTIGKPKMCGEFIAPVAVAQLEKWNVHPIQSIEKAIFFAKQSKLNLTFPQIAGAFSRSDAERQLAQRAIEKGGQIRENSIIQDIQPATQNTPHCFLLQSGEKIFAEHAIFATGKKQLLKKPLPYFGFKIHIKKIIKPSTLLMHSLPGAYFGIVPISEQTSNCACLVSREKIEEAGSCKNFFYQLLKEHSELKNIFENTDLDDINWLEGTAPEFGLKKIPVWPRSFWIGDALAAIPPAIGYGFAHSIKSAVLAADLYQQQSLSKSFKKNLRTTVLAGKFLHQLLLHPSFGSLTFPFAQKNPWIYRRFLRLLHQISQ